MSYEPLFPKSKRMKKLADDDDANLAAGASIGFAIGLIVVFVLSPLVLSQHAAVADDPNASTTDVAILGLLKLAWFISPVLTAFAGGAVGKYRS